MREIYRNPVMYYLLIPALVGMWPLLVRCVYLPQARRSAETEYNLYVDGQNYIIDILQIDSERLKFADVNEVSGEFSYVSAVDRVANLCRIPAGGWEYTAGNIIPVNGKRRQDAGVKVTNVSIVQAARFLTTIQSLWVNLTCDKVKLVKKKGMKDQWDVDYHFVYYY